MKWITSARTAVVLGLGNLVLAGLLWHSVKNGIEIRAKCNLEKQALALQIGEASQAVALELREAENARLRALAEQERALRPKYENARSQASQTVTQARETIGGSADACLDIAIPDDLSSVLY